LFPKVYREPLLDTSQLQVSPYLVHVLIRESSYSLQLYNQRLINYDISSEIPNNMAIIQYWNYPFSLVFDICCAQFNLKCIVIDRLGVARSQSRVNLFKD